MVIQRLQSLLLLVATILMGVFSYLTISAFHTEAVTNNMPLIILSILAALLPFISIFLYRQTSFQRTLCKIEMLFIVCAAALTGYTASQDATIGLPICILSILAVVALILTIWADRRIAKDMALLRAADRLR
jgi:hypothetical protein